MVKLVYDLESLPDGLSPADFMKMYDNHGVVLWSSNKGTRPKLYNTKEDSKDLEDLIIVDIAGKDVDFEVFEKEYVEKEYWDKEVHKCTNSPMYYYKTYAATELPVNNEGMSMFLKELGLDQLVIEGVDTTIEDNKSKWEKQKEVMKKALSFIDVDHLKKLKSGRELLEERLKIKTTKLEKELESIADLKDSEGKLLLEKKRVINLVKAISKLKTIPEKYKEYEFKKQTGRWDKAMLGQTPYYTLLVILKETKELYDSATSI